jgi:Transposase and inactivated derivatives
MAYKNYTSEFKAKVVIEVLQGEKSLSEIAAHYNLNPNMVRTWKAEFIENAGVVFENPKKAEKDARRKEAALKKETDRMLKTIGQLKLERDFLQDCFRQSGLPVPELDSEEQ